MAKSKKSASKTTYIHVAVAFIGFILIKWILLKPVNGLTDIGVSVIAVAFTIMYLWIFVAVDWVSFFGLGLLALTGVMTPNELIAGGFGSWVSAFCIITSILNMALYHSGIISRLVVWFITRPVVKGKPWVFLTLYFFSVYFVTLFVDIVTAALVLLPIATAICEEFKYVHGEKFPKVIFAGTMWSMLLGFAATPILHSVSLLVLGLMEKIYGVSVSFSAYIAVGVPSTMVLFAVQILIFKFVLKPDLANYVNYDVEAKRATITKMSLKEKLTLFIFIIIIFSFFVPDIFAKLMPSLAAAWKGMGLVIPAALGVGVLCIIHVEDEPLLDFKRALTDVSWSTVILVIGMYILTPCLSAASTGIPTFLQNLFTPLVQSTTSWFVLAAVATIWVLVMTNFMSCTVTANLVFVVCGPLALSLVPIVNPYAIGIIIAIMANIGVMTPPASSPAAVYTGTAWFKPNDAFKTGIMLVAACIVVGIFICYPLANIFFPL